MSKSVAYYYHRQIGRIGELISQTFMVRNLYPENEYDVVLLVPPFGPSSSVNSAVLELCTRGIKVVTIKEQRDIDIIIEGHIADNTPYIFINKSPWQLSKEFITFLRDNQFNYSLRLTASDFEKGADLKRKMGIPQDAKIVTLHVREPGYLPTLSYHGYRDADIINYLYAIMYLVKRGYYVIRLGDKSMKPLDNIGPQLIDAPFHPLYCDFFEPYFIAISSFYIGMPSGPMSVANCFGIPILLTNSFPMPAVWGRTGDIWLFKKYYSHQLGRTLTYEEIVLSNVLNYNCSEIYRESGISLLENTPEELMSAVIEMDDRLNGCYEKMNLVAQFNLRAADINLKADVIRHACIRPITIRNFITLFHLHF